MRKRRKRFSKKTKIFLALLDMLHETGKFLRSMFKKTRKLIKTIRE